MSMASNPPFQVEDQTDEDFFDKLVNDDDDDNYNVDLSSSALEFGDDNDLDEAKAFADLDDSGGENGSGAIVRVVKTASVVSRTSGSVSEYKVDEISTLLSSAGSDHVVESNEVMTTSTELPNLAVKSSLDTYDVIKPDNDIKGTMMVPDLSANKSSGSGSSGIKEVQWSAFDSDALPNGVTGVESYSDIFGEFGDGEKIEESLTTESNVVYGSAYSDNTHSYYEYQDGQVNAAEPIGQDMNSVEYWENLYPGWKYDQNTGQWYQVDGYDATTSVEGSSLEVSYLHQTSQSGVGTVLQNATTESVTNWNLSAHLGETTDLAFNCNQVTQTTDGTAIVSNWNQ